MEQTSEPRFLDERLAHWAQVKPDEQAIIYLDRSFTWGQ
jgi:hypothetical protein